METILMVIHLVIVAALILVILIQRSGQDGLSGLSGGAQGGSNALFNIRGKANVLSRATGILATIFLCTSLALAYIATHKGGSIADRISAQENVEGSAVQKVGPKDGVPTAIEPTKTEVKGEPAKAAPAKPVAPQVPLAN